MSLLFFPFPLVFSFFSIIFYSILFYYSTYQNGCKAHSTARASSDGKKLETRSLEEQHNHVVNPELFRNLPHNRKLDNEQKENVLQMLEMKANKKIIQSHVMKSTGRILLMKDIHNIKQSGEKKSNDMSTLQSAVNELNKWAKI